MAARKTAGEESWRRQGDRVSVMLAEQISSLEATIVDGNSRLIDMQTKLSVNAEKMSNVEEKVSEHGKLLAIGTQDIKNIQIQQAKADGALSALKWIGGGLGGLSTIFMGVAAVLEVIRWSQGR